MLNANKPPRFRPRQQRALAPLWAGPKLCEVIDWSTGCSNGPQLIKDLLAKGIEIRCDLIESLDRDGTSCKPSRYELTNRGREKLDCLGWASGERTE